MAARARKMMARPAVAAVLLQSVFGYDHTGVLHGPLQVRQALRHVPGMALNERRVDVWYPVASEGAARPFKFLAFAHGATRRVETFFSLGY